MSSRQGFLRVNTFFCLIAAENFAVTGNIKCIVTGYGGFRSFWISRLMILLRVGNRSFCFANNSGAFLDTIKMAIKGAKMCVIVNSKMQSKIWYGRMTGNKSEFNPSASSHGKESFGMGQIYINWETSGHTTLNRCILRASTWLGRRAHL